MEEEMREKKSKHLSQDGSRRKARARMGDGQVGSWGSRRRNSCIRIGEGRGGERER